jgi:Tol biopolymer transport system component
VAFISRATSLVPGDINNRTPDVFVRDRVAGTTRLVSVTADGQPPNRSTWLGDISADGRYVVFETKASNLVPGDTNNRSDIFVRDMVAGTTQRLSVSTTGTQADDNSYWPTISADGRYVAFGSGARNLLPSSPRDGIFVRDLQTGAMELVSVNPREEPGNGTYYLPRISATGRFVAFTSVRWMNFGKASPPGRMDVYLRDRLRGTTRLVSTPVTGPANTASHRPVSQSCGVSADGRYVTFLRYPVHTIPETTTDFSTHVYLRDMRRGTTTLIDRGSDGSQGDGESYTCELSSDGRYVAFTSGASNLVPGDTNRKADAFVWCRRTHRIVRVSVNNAGHQADRGVGHLTFMRSLAVSATGSVVAFTTPATNLVSGDTNDRSDVFVRYR